MNLKSLKIHIQHSPITGDPDEWIMDVQADGDVHKETSFKAPSLKVLLDNLSSAINEVRYERCKTLRPEVFQSTGEPAAGV